MKYLSLISLLLLTVNVVLSVRNATYCYTGSSLYQSVITDCTLQDTSYTGNWFCSQISVCEAYISDSRECIKSKGCAKEEQCTCVNSNCQSTTLSSTDGSAVYAGPLTNSGENPGGYTIDIYCCQSKIFPSDDLVAINYNDICNSASKFSYSISFIIMMFVTILFILSI